MMMMAAKCDGGRTDAINLFTRAWDRARRDDGSRIILSPFRRVVDCFCFVLFDACSSIHHCIASVMLKGS
jgi:hypothetical protein